MPWKRYSDVANTGWRVWANDDDGKYDSDAVNRAILLDIRAELQRLNTLLGCPNFIGIPATLDAIRQQTRKPTRKRKRKAG